MLKGRFSLRCPLPSWGIWTALAGAGGYGAGTYVGHIIELGSAIDHQAVPEFTKFIPFMLGFVLALFALLYLFRKTISAFYHWTQATYIKSMATGALIFGGYFAIVLLLSVTMAIIDSRSAANLRTGFDLVLRIVTMILGAAILGGAWGFINTADRRSQFLPLVALKYASIYALGALAATGIYIAPYNSPDNWPLSSAQTLVVAAAGALLGLVLRFWSLRQKLIQRFVDLIIFTVNFTTRTSRAAAGAGRVLGGLVLIALSAIPLSLIPQAFNNGQTTSGAYLLALLAAGVGTAFVYTGFYQASHGLLTLWEAFAPNRFDLGNAAPIFGQAENATLRKVKDAMAKPSAPFRQRFKD